MYIYIYVCVYKYIFIYISYSKPELWLAQIVNALECEAKHTLNEWSEMLLMWLLDLSAQDNLRKVDELTWHGNWTHIVELLYELYDELYMRK